MLDKLDDMSYIPLMRRDTPASQWEQTEMKDERKVIPHPRRPGYWTICITDDRGAAIYGEYDRRELALAVMLTR